MQDKSKLKPPVWEDSYSSFGDVAKLAASCVYSILRVDKLVDSANYRINPLGTGFLAGSNRMITCSHLFKDTQVRKNKGFKKDRDEYKTTIPKSARFLFVNKYWENWHMSPLVELKDRHSLFTYPEIDFAVIHLPDEFYATNGTYYQHPENYLRLSKDDLTLGYETALLGYPGQKIPKKVNSPQDIVGKLNLRARQGIINSRRLEVAWDDENQKENVKAYMHDFSTNAGSSGAPVFDSKSGKVIAYHVGSSYDKNPYKKMLKQNARSFSMQNPIDKGYLVTHGLSVY